MKPFITILLFFLFGNLQSQSIQDLEIGDLENHAILNHYSKKDLKTLYETDTVKFYTVIYYYTKSFILTPIPCTDCIDFDLKKFDVSTVEKYRKQSVRFEHEFDKYGVKLTLLSIDELEYKLPIHN